MCFFRSAPDEHFLTTKQLAAVLRKAGWIPQLHFLAGGSFAGDQWHRRSGIAVVGSLDALDTMTKPQAKESDQEVRTKPGQAMEENLKRSEK